MKYLEPSLISPETSDEVDSSAVLAELARILASEAFQAAERQQQFLKFIVETALRGETGALLGKNLASDFFHLDETSTQDVSTVRVEAGRLRRRLHMYYKVEGAGNPARIEIPKGSYVPVFSVRQDQDDQAVRQSGRRWLWFVLAGVVAAFAVLAVDLTKDKQQSAIDSIDPVFTESAEAYSMFFEARRLANPPTIKARVEAAISLAHEIQQLDPSFAGGYAAEAYLLWHYVVFGHSSDPQMSADRSLELAEKAIATDPEFSWGHYALASAYALAGRSDETLNAMDRAIDLNPEVANHHAWKGLFLATTNGSPKAIELTRRALELSDGNARIEYRNLHGVALFHGGKFADAAEVIDSNRKRGGPSGPHMLVYLAAAYALAGNVGHADAAANLLRTNPIVFVPGDFLDHMVLGNDQKEIVIEGLLKSGLTREEISSGFQ